MAFRHTVFTGSLILVFWLVSLPVSAAVTVSGEGTENLLIRQKGAVTTGQPFRSLLTVPALAVDDNENDASVMLRYRNLPALTRIALIDAKEKQEADVVWEYGTEAGGTGVINLALPARLKKGMYYLRAGDMGGQLIYAETATFRASGRGAIDTTYRKSQRATFRIFAADSFTQEANVTRTKARALCKAAERKHEGSAVLCTWNDRQI